MANTVDQYQKIWRLMWQSAASISSSFLEIVKVRKKLKS